MTPGSEVVLEQGVSDGFVGKIAAGLDQGTEAFGDNRAAGARSSP